MKTSTEPNPIREPHPEYIERLLRDIQEQQNTIADLKYQLQYRTLQRMQLGILLEGILEKLTFISHKIPVDRRDCHDCISKCILMLKQNRNNHIWREFRMRFSDVHTGFYDRLITVYPALTEHDLRLCAFIKLKMSSKEIALVLNQPVNSVKMARKRLREKLHIEDISVKLIQVLAVF